MANALDSRIPGTDTVRGGAPQQWAAGPVPLSPADIESELALEIGEIRRLCGEREDLRAATSDVCARRPVVECVGHVRLLRSAGDGNIPSARAERKGNETSLRIVKPNADAAPGVPGALPRRVYSGPCFLAG